MRYEARMINDTLHANQLPRTYTYPGAGICQGAQVIGLGTALSMAVDGADAKDDWFQQAWHYDHLAILEVAGTSGDTIGIGYQAVTPEDVKHMWVMPLGEVAWMLTEIALEKGYDTETEWWRDLYDEELLPLLKSHLTAVAPEWITTV